MAGQPPPNCLEDLQNPLLLQTSKQNCASAAKVDEASGGYMRHAELHCCAVTSALKTNWVRETGLLYGRLFEGSVAVAPAKFLQFVNYLYWYRFSGRSTHTKSEITWLSGNKYHENISIKMPIVSLKPMPEGMPGKQWNF